MNKNNVVGTVAVILALGMVIWWSRKPIPTQDKNLVLVEGCGHEGFQKLVACADRQPASGLEYDADYRVVTGELPPGQCVELQSRAAPERREGLRCDLERNPDCAGLCAFDKPEHWYKTRCPRGLKRREVQCVACRYRMGDDRFQMLMAMSPACTDVMVFHGINASFGEVVCDKRLKFSACP